MNNEGKVIDINLALKKEDIQVMSEMQIQMLEEEIKALPPMKENDITINGIYNYDLGDKLEVSIYIRNGFVQQLALEKVPFVIKDENNNVIAAQIFDMKGIGIIPPKTGRPYKLYFKKENISVDNIPEKWSVAFNNNIKAVQNVAVELEELPKGISHEFEKVIHETLDAQPMLKDKEVSLTTFNVTQKENGDIFFFILIRNGHDKEIEIKKLPIKLIDEDNKIMAEGKYSIDNIKVGARKAKVYNFTMKAEKIKKEDFDLNKCRIIFA